MDKVCKKINKLINIFKTNEINQQQAAGLNIVVDVVIEKSCSLATTLIPVQPALPPLGAARYYTLDFLWKHKRKKKRALCYKLFWLYRGVRGHV